MLSFGFHFGQMDKTSLLWLSCNLYSKT